MVLKEGESKDIMDPIMELALLQRRFPEVPVKDYGKLVKGLWAFCLLVVFGLYIEFA